MKHVHGFYFPDYDDHFPRLLEKSLNKDGVLRYQWRQRDFAMNLCKHKRVCIDIGANVGLWSCDLVQKFEVVVAFEPVAEFRSCYEKNISKNNYILHPVALGQSESMIKMNIIKGNTGHSHVDLSSFGSGDVPLKTLDSFQLTNVDLIKIDVEGFEEQILLGASETICTNKPVLVVEQQKHEYKNDITDIPAVKMLENWGYVVQAQFNKDWILQWQN